MDKRWLVFDTWRIYYLRVRVRVRVRVSTKKRGRGRVRFEK